MAGWPWRLQKSFQGCDHERLLMSVVVFAQNRARKPLGFGLGLERRPVWGIGIQTSNLELEHA